MAYIRFIVDGIWFIIGFLGISNFFSGSARREAVATSLPLLISCAMYFYTLMYRDLNRLYASGLSIAVLIALLYALTSVLCKKDKVLEKDKKE